ncbi:hypothetical protein MTHERMMSTA1_14120 [Methanosarcina thermophila MST-A1]|nr:hypothetical protein MTHERMMSTA1_14120 [Methanosarcina thermophila MST-A1]
MNPILAGTVLLTAELIVTLVIFRLLHVPPLHDTLGALAIAENGINTSKASTKKMAIRLISFYI